MAPRAEVVVACTHCGAERKTKAQRGVRLACTSCGETFRRPDVEPSPPADPDPSPPPRGEASPAAAAEPSPAGVPEGFETASPKVRKTARPRARGADASPAADAEPSPELEGDEDWQEKLGPRATPAQLRPAGQRRAQRAGRRGGRSRAAGIDIYKGIVG